MKVTDTILGPVRGDRVTAINAGARLGAKRLNDVDALITTYYRFGPLIGIDPAIATAAAYLETGNFTNRWWTERLNAGSLGVTGDPAQNEASPTFATGEEAAMAHLAHLLVYALGPTLAAMKWRYRFNSDLELIDPRFDAYLDAYGDVAKAPTIAGLSGTYAADPRYAEKIVARAADVFGPTIPDQAATATPFPFDLSLTTRDLGRFVETNLWITVHNTGNNATRQAERAFVQSGGGSGGVLYHFAVDETGVTQIEKLDRRGIHAGNAQGNATSIAIEMCELREPWSTIKEHTATLLAEIVTNAHGILDYGVRGPEHFSLDRVKEHRDWPGANPNCPRRLIADVGGVEPLVARARGIVAVWTAVPEPIPEPEPEPEPSPFPRTRIPAPDGFTAQGHDLILFLEQRYATKRFRCVQGTTFRTAPSRDAPAGTKTPAKRGRSYRFVGMAPVDGELWVVSAAGSWCPLKNFEEV